MPCYQAAALPAGVTTSGRASHATQEACLQTCQEGACCEGTTCSVKPQCQCQAAGQTFKGVGTTCEPNPCGFCMGNGTIGSCDPNAGGPSYVSPAYYAKVNGLCPTGTKEAPAEATVVNRNGYSFVECDFGLCLKLCDGTPPNVARATTVGGQYLCLSSGSTSANLAACAQAGGAWVYCANGNGKVGQYACDISNLWDINPLP